MTDQDVSPEALEAYHQWRLAEARKSEQQTAGAGPWWLLSIGGLMVVAAVIWRSVAYSAWERGDAVNDLASRLGGGSGSDATFSELPYYSLGGLGLVLAVAGIVILAARS